MPEYRVLARSFIGDRLVEAGEIVEYDGNPSPENLQPLCAEGARRMDEHLRAEDERLLGPDPALEPAPASLADMIAAAVKEAAEAEGKAVKKSKPVV